MPYFLFMFLKWLPEGLVCFVGTIYFLVYFWIHNMYPHEIATIEALKKHGIVPRENTKIRINGWIKRDDDDFNTLMTHDIYNYKMPHALFFNPNEKVNRNLSIFLSVCSTSERNAERAKQQEIEKKLNILIYSTPSHSELYNSRLDELDALRSTLKNPYTTVTLTLPIHNSATEFLMNYIESDEQSDDLFFIKSNKKK